ncbi:MAG: VCBS repeat-containing protein [Candidatus Cloacimonetes bacterium]|nr:VCBS repeat-containing protein [Candidatus Cloacimonadota bacterium]
MKAKTINLIVICILFASWQILNAETIYVDVNGGGNYLTIQEGINAAGDGDTVLVADGIYTGNNNKDLTWNGNVKHLIVKSENGPENCIIDCENDGRGFSLSSTYQDNSDIIDGFTITNARETWGGGIKCYYASPTIQNNIIKNCVAGDGGNVGPGGGILLYHYCNAIVQNNIIENNIASANNLSGGGGVHCYHNDDTGSMPIIRNNIIRNNQALIDINGGGGGITVYYSSPIIENNLIYDNDTDWYGGGIHCIHGGSPIIRNNIIFGNTTTHTSPAGGGISVVGGHPTLINNIIAGNNDYGIYYSYGSITTDYCDVWDNELGNYCSCSPGIGCISEAPLFVDVFNYDFHFQANSPCIDTGTPDTTGMNLYPFDLDGNPRVFDGDGDGIAIIDMGCYEYGSSLPTPVFIDVASEYGVDDSRKGIGTVWFDYDNDGDLDILMTTESSGNYPALYRNDGNWFVDVAVEVGLPASSSRLSIGDYDNDNDIDILYAKLLRNDINEINGFTEVGYYGRATFVDYDNDGDLDIYCPLQGSSSGNGAPNRLFRNDGDAGFVEIVGALGAAGNSFSRTAVWGDYDNDGDMDVYVVNGRGQRCSLYRNDVNTIGLFTDVTNAMGVGNTQRYADGASWADYDNDGDLDLYLNKHDGYPNRLYRNDGYIFTDVAVELGVANNLGGFHSSWCDYDNDGDLDLYVTSWQGYPNCLYRNEVSEGNGFVETYEMQDIPGTGMGGSWGDFDCDGDLDYYLVSGYYSSEPNRLYLNSSSENGNHWLHIKAIGTISNYAAIGTTIRVVAGDLLQLRYVESTSGFGSQNSLIVEFGLGTHSAVDSVIVNWPSGIIQVLTDVDVDQFLTVIEPYSPTEPIYLEIPTEYAWPSDTVLVPINVQFPPDSTFNSAEIYIGGYLGFLDFIEIVTDSSLIGDAGWMYESNETDSLNIIWTAGAEEISGEGVLFWLKFAVPDTASNFVPITLEYALFDTGDIPVELISGGISILTPMYGDVDLNGQIQAYDASMILRYLVGYIDLNELQLVNADVSLDSTVSALDATLILQYGVGIIDTLPYPTGTVFIATGDMIMEDQQIQPGAPISIPLILENSDNIFSFEAKILFNPEHLTYTDIIWSELLESFTIENNNESGEIKISGASVIPNDEEGLFANIWFTVSNDFGENDTTMVTLQSLRWNEEVFMEDVAISILRTSVGTGNPQTEIPDEYVLSQNIPNPFSTSGGNFTTKIQYSLPHSSNVSLKIYNIKGELVKTLVSENKSAGSYNVIWDGKNEYGNDVVSGIYFYKIQTDKFSEIKKMLLVR